MAMEIKQAQNSFLKNKGFIGFLYGYVPFLAIGLFVLLLIKHGDVVLFVNRYSLLQWDGCFEFLTNFGLGTYTVVIMVALLFVRVRYGLNGLVSIGVVGLFSPLFKKVLFSNQIRPLNYFYYDDFHRFIYTADLNYYFSFPSGHTMSIFSAMSILAFVVGRKWAGVLFFFGALLVGFSRIYLLQHFFRDVYVGSMIGVLSTLIALWLTGRVLHLQRFSWFEKPIYRIRF